MSILYLIDTNVISELARKTPDQAVTAFIASAPALLVSTILFHELSYGLEMAPVDQRMKLIVFIGAMKMRFASKAIAVSVEIAETAGRLRAFAKTKGRILSVADALIAATAMITGSTLVTRNIKDFEYLSLTLCNPFTPA